MASRKPKLYSITAIRKKLGRTRDFWAGVLWWMRAPITVGDKNAKLVDEATFKAIEERSKAD